MSSAARTVARRLSGPPGTILLWALAMVATAWFFARVLLPAVGFDSFGFASYYTAARLVVSGELDARIYDNAWFQERERALGLRNDIYGHQPPTMALLMLPVAWLPPAVARASWLALDLLWLLLIGVLAARSAASLGGRATLATVALMLLLVALFRPLHAELRYAQVHTLMALWYAVWLYGFVSGRDWLCGAALALLALAKLAGAPLWLLLLVAGRWRALFWAAALAGAGFMGTLPLVGVGTWQAYLFGRVGDLAANPVFGVTALQTLTSLLRQLFVFDAAYTPAPLLHAPGIATALWIAATAALLVPTLAGARRRPRLLAGAAMLCLVVPTQPAGEQHHYVMLLTPFFVALLLAHKDVLAGVLSPQSMQGRAEQVAVRQAVPGGATGIDRARGPRLALLLAGIGAALMLTPNYFLDNAAWAGWPRALLAYPRLYGALLLWGAFICWPAHPVPRSEPPPAP